VIPGGYHAEKNNKKGPEFWKLLSPKYKKIIQKKGGAF
jgi:hypothetical protein